MRRAVVALALGLAACRQADPSPANQPAAADVATDAATAIDERRPANETTPARPADTGSAGATAALRSYLEAIAAKRWTQGHRQWGDDGAALAFERRWRDAASVRGQAGAPSLPEGGCGSIYVEMPVRFVGVRLNGARFAESGTAVIRRVNGVDGATPRQLAWHIDSIRMDDAP